MEDVKKKADMYRSAAQVAEVLAPWSEEDRMDVLTCAVKIAFTEEFARRKTKEVERRRYGDGIEVTIGSLDDILRGMGGPVAR